MPLVTNHNVRRAPTIPNDDEKRRPRGRCYYFSRGGKIRLPLFVFRGVRARIVASASYTIGKLEFEWNSYAMQRCDAITRPFANEQMMNGPVLFAGR